MALPDFLVGGVAKAGTTALYAALRRHPQLFLPTVKEPKFFLTDGPPPATAAPATGRPTRSTSGGEPTTRRCSTRRRAGHAARRGHPVLPVRAVERTGGSTRSSRTRRIILMLRDPVDRAHSNWAHLWSAGLEPEADFLAACAAEPARRAAGWAHFWHYLAQGRYGEQVAHLLRGLPARAGAWCCRYRDLRERPQWDARPGLRVPRRPHRPADRRTAGECHRRSCRTRR